MESTCNRKFNSCCRRLILINREADKLTKYFLSAPSELHLLGLEKEVQLLKSYAFNAYFNADPLYTDDVNNGHSYRRDAKGGLDAVFINEALEENTIECLHSYYVGEEPFVLNKVFNALSVICTELDDVRKGIFVNNKEADDLLKEYLEESVTKKVIIRIITDYSCSPNEKYDLSKKIESFLLSVTGLDVSAVITFGDEPPLLYKIHKY